MNQKIKKLLLHAGIYDGREGIYWCDESNLEKFSELIIKECVQVCEDGKGWVPNLHWIPESAGKYWDQACEHRANAIKKHFGVE